MHACPPPTPILLPVAGSRLAGLGLAGWGRADGSDVHSQCVRRLVTDGSVAHSGRAFRRARTTTPSWRSAASRMDWCAPMCPMDPTRIPVPFAHNRTSVPAMRIGENCDPRHAARARAASPPSAHAGRRRPGHPPHRPVAAYMSWATAVEARRIRGDRVVPGGRLPSLCRGAGGRVGVAWIGAQPCARVTVDIEGWAADLAAFERRVAQDAPPLARVLAIVSTTSQPTGATEFVIAPSRERPGQRTLVPHRTPRAPARLSPRTSRPGGPAISPSVHHVHQLRAAAVDHHRYPL